MNCHSLLDSLAKKGVTFEIEGGNLVAVGSQRLTDQDRIHIREHKSELLEPLKNHQCEFSSKPKGVTPTDEECSTLCQQGSGNPRHARRSEATGVSEQKQTPVPDPFLKTSEDLSEFVIDNQELLNPNTNREVDCDSHPDFYTPANCTQNTQNITAVTSRACSVNSVYTSGEAGKQIEDQFDQLFAKEREYLLGNQYKPERCIHCGRFGIHGEQCEMVSPEGRFTLSFGKHKGKPMQSVPVDYLQWLLTKSERTLSPEMKAEAMRQIHNRSGTVQRMVIDDKEHFL